MFYINDSSIQIIFHMFSFNANAVLHPTVPVHLYIFGKSDTGSFDTEVNCSC